MKDFRLGQDWVSRTTNGSGDEVPVHGAGSTARKQRAVRTFVVHTPTRRLGCYVVVAIACAFANRPVPWEFCAIGAMLACYYSELLGALREAAYWFDRYDALLRGIREQ